ncbi:hypothetical protein D9619_003834 [Psilocybe cf. subviscida]|uniref:Glycolipid transfer protein domain-containing protein n=1 Tax=Psilocybe cf. subviscida TaxID=2480587 RepID=A0A8H5EUF8_9AGAR|nr:hypothetical protein D9619_003834 [Psilocybe cf. subviscida]
MAPYFETVKSFADVPITDAGVETAPFIEAADGLVLMFDLLGSGIFGFVQNDIRNNINGVRSRFQALPDQTHSLEQLVRTDNEPKHATPCLVRLIRGLLFTCRALQHMQRDRNAALHVCFKRSYDEVLKHHHNFVIRSTVSVAIRAVPYRNDFYNRIAQGGSHERLDEELAKWLDGLDKVVSHVERFLREGGYGRV